MHTYLPKNLDLFQIVQNHPPAGIEKFDIEKLKHFLGLIDYLPANNKDLELKNGFTPLHSRKLKNKAANYLSYFEYAIEQGIIISDHQWIEGQKSIGYRFTEKYRMPIVRCEILNKRMRQTAQKKKNKRTKTTNQIRYITQYFDQNLIIDEGQALHYANAIYEYKSASKDNRDINFEKTRNDRNGVIHYKNPFVQHNHTLACLDKVIRGEWNLYRDPTVNRFHTTLTQMPGGFRNLLSYNGKKLVACDIRNSQPYLLCRLLQPSFYYTQTHPKDQKKFIKSPFGKSNAYLTDQHLEKFLTNAQSVTTRPDFGAQFSFSFSFSLEKESKRVKSHTLKNILKPHLTTPLSLIKW